MTLQSVYPLPVRTTRPVNCTFLCRSSVIIIPDLLYRAVKTYVPEIRHLVKELYYKYRYNYRNRKIFLYYFSSHLMIAFFTL